MENVDPYNHSFVDLYSEDKQIEKPVTPDNKILSNFHKLSRSTNEPFFVRKANSSTKIDDNIRIQLDLSEKIKKISEIKSEDLNYNFLKLMKNIFREINNEYPMDKTQLEDLEYQRNTLFVRLVESRHFNVKNFYEQLNTNRKFLQIATKRIQAIMIRLKDYFSIEQNKTEFISLYVENILKLMNPHLNLSDFIHILNEPKVKKILVNSIGGNTYYNFLESMNSQENLSKRYEKIIKEGKVKIKEESGVLCKFFTKQKKIDIIENLFCKRLKNQWIEYDKGKNQCNLQEFTHFINEIQRDFFRKIYCKYFNSLIASYEAVDERYRFLSDRVFINQSTEIDKENFIFLFEQQKKQLEKDPSIDLSFFRKRITIAQEMIARIQLMHVERTEWMDSFNKELASLLKIECLLDLKNKMEQASPKTKECLSAIFGGDAIYSSLPIFAHPEPAFIQLIKVLEKANGIFKEELCSYKIELKGLNLPYGSKSLFDEKQNPKEHLKLQEIVRYLVPNDYSERKPRFRTVFDRLTIQGKLIEFDLSKVELSISQKISQKMHFQAKILKIILNELEKAGWDFSVDDPMDKERQLEKEIITLIKMSEEFLDENHVSEILKNEGFPKCAKILGLMDTFNTYTYIIRNYLDYIRANLLHKYGNRIYIAFEGKNVENTFPISFCNLQIMNEQGDFKILHTLRMNIYYSEEELNHGKEDAKLALRCFFKWIIKGSEKEKIEGELRLVGIELGEVPIEKVEGILDLLKVKSKNKNSNEEYELSYSDLLDTEEMVLKYEKYINHNISPNKQEEL